jgi:YNFM family putative membrane transporter
MLCGCTLVLFADMYATQPILPLLSHAFSVSPAQAGLTISAVALGIALASPLLGFLGDRFGRKRVIVASAYALAAATLLCSFAHAFTFLLAARFLQGIAIPGVNAVGVAYIGDRVERAVHAQYVSIYVAANSLGGLLGRVISGLIGGTYGWAATFVVYGALTLAMAVVMHAALRRGTATHAPPPMLAALGSHLRNPSLIGANLAGASAFFAFTAVFTYLPYLLSRPPFSLPVEKSSLVYLAYAAGVTSSMIAGRLAARRNVIILIRVGILIACTGCAVTLVPSLGAVVLGCVVLCTGMFFVQGLAPGYVNRTAVHARAAANALYQTAYYIGAMLGGLLPGIAYERAGWNAVILVCGAAMVLAFGSSLVMKREVAA